MTLESRLLCSLYHYHSVALKESEQEKRKARGMRPLLRMYELHKREFGIHNNTFFRLVEQFLSTTPCSLLECSVKIFPKGIHPKRIRFGYGQEDIQEGLHEILQFLERIAAYRNVDLDRALLDKIVDAGLDVSKVVAAGVGLDYRHRSRSSKVKCYFRIRDYPEKVDQILSTHPPVDHIRDYLIHDLFLFGIDMYFDGRTGVEIYPFFDRKDLRDPELIDKLRLRKVIDGFIKECKLLYISFDRGGKRILHVYPIHPTRFIRSLGNRQLSLVYSNVQIIRYLLSRLHKADPIGITLALVEDEIVSKNMRHMNLHYAITSRV
jgi:LynF/TruF/PatF family peptide O-prenyltransferase